MARIEIADLIAAAVDADPTITGKVDKAGDTITGDIKLQQAQQTADYPLKVGTGNARGAPATGLTLSAGGSGGSLGVGTYKYWFTETDLVGETTVSPVASVAVTSGQKVTITLPHYRRPGTVAYKLYRSVVGGSSPLYLDAFGGGFDSHQRVLVDAAADGALGAAAPSSDTTQTWNFLAQPNGMVYLAGDATKDAAANFTFLGVDGDNGASWNIDSYGPIASRTALGSNFVAYHTDDPSLGEQGFVLASYYFPATKTSGQSATFINGIYPQGGFIAKQVAGSAHSGLHLEGIETRAAIKVIKTLGDANGTFLVDGDGKHTWGPGGATAPDTSISRAGVGQLNVAAQILLGGASGAPSATLQVKPSSGSGTLRVHESGGVGINVVAAAGGPHTIGTSNNLALNLQQNGTTLIGFGAGATLGFFAATPVAKPTVSGAKGSNAALGSLLTALASLGLITDSSSA